MSPWRVSIHVGALTLLGKVWRQLTSAARLTECEAFLLRLERKSLTGPVLVNVLCLCDN
jgi:hypothetical protein